MWFESFCKKISCCQSDHNAKNYEQELGEDQSSTSAPISVQMIGHGQKKLEVKEFYQSEPYYQIQSELTNKQIYPAQDSQQIDQLKKDKQCQSIQNNVLNFIKTLLDRKIEKATSPRLVLKLIESKELDRDDIFEIYPQEMIGSKRQALDGVTIVGTQYEYQSDLLNVKCADLIIPNDQFGFGPKHFVVYFEPQVMKYFIVDLYQGTGTYLLIDQPLLIQSGQIIQFGSSYMNLTIEPDSSISIYFSGGVLQGESFNYLTTQSEITIGRHSSSVINVRESGLSRVQCSISYTNQGWVIKDGDGEKISTNGTWQFISEPFLVYDQMIFKAGKSIFKVKFS